MTRVTLARTPVGTPVRSLTGVGWPWSGGTLCVLRPDTNLLWAAYDVLAGLGCRMDTSFRVTSEAMAILLAGAWLAAHCPRVLAVASAENADDVDVLDTLLHLAEGCGADLVLVTESDEDEAGWLDEWCVARGGTVAPDAAVEVLAPYAGEPVPGVEAYPLPRFAPRADFHLWRSWAQTVLPPSEFETVDHVYRAVFREYRDDPPQTADAALDRLQASLSGVTAPGHAVAVVRAAQAAMFTRGLHLKADVDVLIATADHDRLRRLDDSEVRSLHAYPQPWVACAVLLDDVDTGPITLRDMPVRGVDDHGNLVGPHMRRKPLLPAARLYFAAHRRVRLMQGAGPDDPFLNERPIRIRAAIRRAEVDLALPPSAPQREPDERKYDRWRRGLGVSVQSLERKAPAAANWGRSRG